MKQIKVIDDKNKLKEIQNITKLAYGKLPWTEKQYEDDWNLNYTKYIGLYINDKLVGYAHFSCIYDEYELLNFAVLPKEQGKNYGFYIITESMNITNMETCMLEVRKSNIKAIKVYQKLNFKIIAERKNYYHDPLEDALIMKWVKSSD